MNEHTTFALTIQRAAIALGIQAAMMEHLADDEALPAAVEALGDEAHALCPNIKNWNRAWEFSIRLFGS